MRPPNTVLDIYKAGFPEEVFMLSPERPVGVNHQEEEESFPDKKYSISDHPDRREHAIPGAIPTTL